MAAEWLVPGHLVFLCNLYFRGFPQPWHPAGLPTTHLSNLLQIVWLFGSYMNSSKRGAAYGFRLQSLDVVRNGEGGPPLTCGMGDGWRCVAYSRSSLQLLEMKSTDRKQTLAALPGEGHC